MNNEIIKITEVKEGNKYIETYRTTDALTVYEDLSKALIGKKLNACQYIRSIKRVPLYNGYQEIVVYYTNNVRSTFIVAN